MDEVSGPKSSVCCRMDRFGLGALSILSAVRGSFPSLVCDLRADDAGGAALLLLLLLSFLSFFISLYISRVRPRSVVFK